MILQAKKNKKMYSLSQEMIRTGEELITGSDSGRFDIITLKKFKKTILPQYLSNQNSEDERFLAFFLINFIEDLFYNLTVDFQYVEEIHAIKIEFFKKMGQCLNKLAGKIKQEDLIGINRILAFLVCSYLDLIDSITSVFEKIDI